MNDRPSFIFVLPTLKSTGGTLETIRLAEDVQCAGYSATIVTMWDSGHAVDCVGVPVVTLLKKPVGIWIAAASLPVVMLSFVFFLCRQSTRHMRIVFTHYSTFILTFLVPRPRRWFFVQDLEWYFVPGGAVRSALRAFILFAYRQGRRLSANDFLAARLEELGLPVACNCDIWANPLFGEEQCETKRDIDVGFILRKGAHKRADWGLALLKQLRTLRPELRILIISPDDGFAQAGENISFLRRPSRTELRSAYQRSRTFVLFSDHEGFGLPPLEAMGCGCVPVCRDAGGIRAYMEPLLEANILPLAATPEAMVRRLGEILDDHDQWSRLSAISRRVFQDGLERSAGRLAALEQCGFIAPAQASP